MCNSIISKSMACLSIFFFKKKKASLLLETPTRKWSYLELRWSELLNPGLKSKPTTRSTLLEYLLHAYFMFILFCNSIFSRDLCLQRRRLWRSYCLSMNHAWNYEKNQGLRKEQIESGSSIKGEDIEALNQQAFYFFSSLPYPLLASIKEEGTEVCLMKGLDKVRSLLIFNVSMLPVLHMLLQDRYGPRWSHARHSLWGMALFYVYRAMDDSYAHCKRSMGLDPQGELSAQNDCSMGFLY